MQTAEGIRNKTCRGPGMGKHSAYLRKQKEANGNGTGSRDTRYRQKSAL